MKAAADQPDQLKKIKPNKAAINRLIARSEKILRGYYRYVEGEERVYLDSKKYIKINFSSSGQQEIVWVIERIEKTEPLIAKALNELQHAIEEQNKPKISTLIKELTTGTVASIIANYASAALKTFLGI